MLKINLHLKLLYILLSLGCMLCSSLPQYLSQNVNNLQSINDLLNQSNFHSSTKYKFIQTNKYSNEETITTDKRIKDPIYTDYGEGKRKSFRFKEALILLLTRNWVYLKIISSLRKFLFLGSGPEHVMDKRFVGETLDLLLTLIKLIVTCLILGVIGLGCYKVYRKFKKH